MMGTTAWRTAWRAVGRRSCAALCQIVALDGTVLRISTAVMPPTDDGGQWDPLLLDGSISSRGNFLSADVTMATARFNVSDAPLSYGGGTPMSTMLGLTNFIGAAVFIWLHETSLSFTTDALLRFVGRIQSHSVRNGMVTFNAMQSRDHNRMLEVRTATRAEFPGLTEDAAGAPLPTIIGNVQGAPLRFHTPSLPYSLLHRFREKLAGGGRAAAAIMVDGGRGGGGTNPPAKVIVAGHKLAQIGAAGPEYGTALFMEGPDGTLNVVEPLPANIFNTDTAAGFLIPDDGGTAWQGVWPVSVNILPSNADNPRAILDRKNEVTFARLNYTAGQQQLQAVFGAMAVPGQMKNVHAYLIYRAAGMNGGLLTIQTPGAPTNTLFTNIPAGGSNVEAALFVDLVGSAGWNTGVLPVNPWDFSRTNMKVGWNPSTPGTNVGTIEVIAMGFTVEYVPQQDVQTIDRKLILVPVSTPQNDENTMPGSPPITTYQQQEVLVNVSELRGKFYANAKGMPDADGTITGTIGGVVERVPDVVRLILQQFGAVDPAAIQTGAGVLGSFVDARAKMLTRRGRDMVLGLHLLASVEVNAALAWLLGATACQLYLSEFDSTWRLIPWITAPAPTYTIALESGDLLDPESGASVSMQPDSDVASGVRIPYGYDSFTKGYSHEVMLSASASNAGHKYRSLRDGIMRITLNENDKIDWSVSAIGFPVITAVAGTFGATITPTLYRNQMDLAVDLTAKMNAADPARKYTAGCGGGVRIDHNNVLEINDGANKTAVIGLPADYDMPGVAAAATAALNAVSSGWTVAYDRPSRRFTIAHATGALVRRTGPFASFGMLTMLGFYNGYNPAGAQSDLSVNAAPAFGQYDREEDTFYVGSTNATLDVLWRNGTNGVLGTKRTAAEVLGFDWSNDSAGGNSSHLGACPKRDLESLVGESDAIYGHKRPLNVDGRALYDTDTALEARDRMRALLSKARGVVMVATEVHADAERGDVIPCGASMDALRGYSVPGSGGSWAGRLFRVLETEQKFGNSWHTELLTIDVTD